MSDDDNVLPRVDLSGMFADMLGTLRLIAVGVRDLIRVTKQTGRGGFLVFAGGGSEMPVQNNTVGTIRQVHNHGGAAVTVVLLDSGESAIYGSLAAPVNIAAGVAVPLYIPFKNGFRAIVTGGYVSIGGDYAE